MTIPSARITSSPTLRILLGLTLLSACGGEAGTDRDSSDVLNGLPEANLVLDLRIDGYEAGLVPVGWMGVGTDGRIAVVQTQTTKVRFFDRSGEPIGEFGGGGEGPGEFRRPLRGGWIGDTLWIDDTQLDRSTLISPELELVRTVANPPALRPILDDTARIPEFGPGTVYAIYRGDTLLVAARPVRGDPRMDVFDGSPLLRVSGDGTINRVVAVRPPDDESGSFFVQFSDGRAAGFPVPFYPGFRWSVSPDGERIGFLTVTIPTPDVGNFRVVVVDGRGNEVFDRSYRTSTLPIPESVVDSVISVRAENASNSEMRRAILSNLKEQIPPTYSPVNDIVIGMEGRIWVSLRPDHDGTPWLVLGPDGEPEMRATLPANTRLMVAEGRCVWGLEVDELGVESIVRYCR